MSSNSFLGRDVDLASLAERTKNFSGAELEGLVKDAAAFALNRNVDFNDLHKPLDEDDIKVGVWVWVVGVGGWGRGGGVCVGCVCGGKGWRCVCVGGEGWWW